MRTVMAQEIAEQPAAIAATLEALRPLRAGIAELAQNRQQILLVARGSSDNAAIYGRYLLEVHAGRTASLAVPSVATHYRRELDLTGALVVSIGGRTGFPGRLQRHRMGSGDNAKRPDPLRVTAGHMPGKGTTPVVTD